MGWLLSLQEDPPSGLFAPKPETQNPRLRAFAPLSPLEWARPLWLEKAKGRGGEIGPCIQVTTPAAACSERTSSTAHVLGSGGSHAYMYTCILV